MSPLFAFGLILCPILVTQMRSVTGDASEENGKKLVKWNNMFNSLSLP